MTHAIRFHKTGGPEVLQWEEVEVGKPGPGEARVRKGAALHAALATDKAFLILRKGMHAGAAFAHRFPPCGGQRGRTPQPTDLSRLGIVQEGWGDP